MKVKHLFNAFNCNYPLIWLHWIWLPYMWMEGDESMCSACLRLLFFVCCWHLNRSNFASKRLAQILISIQLLRLGSTVALIYSHWELHLKKVLHYGHFEYFKWKHLGVSLSACNIKWSIYTKLLIEYFLWPSIRN